MEGLFVRIYTDEASYIIHGFISPCTHIFSGFCETTKFYITTGNMWGFVTKDSLVHNTFKEKNYISWHKTFYLPQMCSAQFSRTAIYQSFLRVYTSTYKLVSKVCVPKFNINCLFCFILFTVYIFPFPLAVPLGGVTGRPAFKPPYGNFFLSAGFKICKK